MHWKSRKVRPLISTGKQDLRAFPWSWWSWQPIPSSPRGVVTTTANQCQGDGPHFAATEFFERELAAILLALENSCFSQKPCQAKEWTALQHSPAWKERGVGVLPPPPSEVFFQSVEGGRHMLATCETLNSLCSDHPLPPPAAATEDPFCFS